MCNCIQTIYFLWGYDPGNVSVSTYPEFITELSPVYCCLVYPILWRYLHNIYPMCCICMWIVNVIHTWVRIYPSMCRNRVNFYTFCVIGWIITRSLHKICNKFPNYYTICVMIVQTLHHCPTLPHIQQSFWAPSQAKAQNVIILNIFGLIHP